MSNLIRKITLIAASFLLIGQSMAAADPSFFPQGPQIDVPVSDVSGGGWTRCYSAEYGELLPTLEVLRTQCEGDYVLYAGGLTADPENFLLLAAGEREVVFAGTDFDLNTVVQLDSSHLSNGTYFYGQDDASVGFTENPTINLWEADLCESNLDGAFTNPDCLTSDGGTKRLSWHGAEVEGGWRIGTITGLNSSNEYVKEIWVANGSPAFRPLAQMSAPAIGVTGGNLTCSAGRYGVADNEVVVDKLTFALYINDSLSSLIPQISGSTAIFDLGSLKNFSAYCQVQAVGFNSSFLSRTQTIIDQAKRVGIAAATQSAEAELEAQRASATAANFTKEAREMRKRIAARSGN